MILEKLLLVEQQTTMAKGLKSLVFLIQPFYLRVSDNLW